MRLLISLVLGVALISSLGVNTQAQTPATTLIVARQADAEGIDPHKVPAHSSWRIYELVYNTLVRLDSSLSVRPELAESWKISSDGKTYTFTLRKGVKFQNGKDFTSADVKYTFERILDEKTGAISRSLFSAVDRIETPDPNTIAFVLKTPSAAFLASLPNPNASIVSREVVSAGDPAKIENTIGTGPYKLESWDPGHSMRLNRNPYFYIKGQPVIGTIQINVMPAEDAILAAMRSKQADFALLEDPKVAKVARGEKGLQFMATPSLRYNLIFINTKRKPFEDVRVRQAVSLAIDRQEIVNAAVFGEGVVTGPFPPSLKRYALPLPQLFGYKPDLEKAKKLLADAGYANGFSFTMLTQTTEPAYAPAIAQIVQAQLKKLNIDMKIEILEFGVWVKHWENADYDMMPALNSGNPDPDYYYYRYMRSDGGLNFVTSYKNPQVDQLLDQGRMSTVANRREETYKQLEKILANDSPFIWLFVGYEYRLLQPYVHGFTPMATGEITYLREATISK